MSKTIAYPVRINPRGGTATEGRNVGSLIALAVMPTGRNSPWDERDQLVVPDHVWEGDGPRVEAAVNASVRGEFVAFERDGRASLRSVERLRGTGDGKVQFTIDWLDLETGATDSTVLPSATGGAG